jgi:endonuclease YncB( thermonuclease family)
MLIATALILCASPTVHDGDTIRCGGERIRIENIDAPELPGSPKCRDRRAAHAWCDYELGYQARDALRSFLSGRQVTIQRTGVDRYGRTLARVSVNGQDAGSYLVGRGLARPWR